MDTAPMKTSPQCLTLFCDSPRKDRPRHLPKLRRCSLLYNCSFHKGYSRGGRASGGSVLEYLPDEGAMLLEALEVLGFLVRSALLPESPEDLQPTFAQATKSAGMTMTRIAFGS